MHLSLTREASGLRPLVMRICRSAGELPCEMESPGDPDVAGIGIVLSFLLTSVIALITIVVGYFQGFLREERYRPADREFIQSCRRLFRVTPPARPRRNQAHVEVFEGFLLSFSDQQLVTGLAVLIALYSKSCNVSVFSFQVATSLSFFSLMLHLSTLAVLRTYLQQNPAVRNLRLAVVVLFSLMMLVSLVLSHSASFSTHPDWQVRCAVERFTFSISPSVAWIQYGNTALVVWFIVSSYGTAIAELYDPEFCRFLGSWYFWLAFKLGNSDLESHLETRMSSRNKNWEEAQARWTKGSRGRARLGIILYAGQEIARSFLWKIVWMMFYFTFALTNFLMAWLQREYFRNGLNTWGFGQIVPMLFLATPLLNVIEAVSNIKQTGRWKDEAEPGGQADVKDGEAVRFWGPEAHPESEATWQVRLLRQMVCGAVLPYGLVLQFYALLVAGLFSVLQLQRTHLLIEIAALSLGYFVAGAHFCLSVLTGLLLRFWGTQWV